MERQININSNNWRYLQLLEDIINWIYARYNWFNAPHIDPFDAHIDSFNARIYSIKAGIKSAEELMSAIIQNWKYQ
jgi:hypothetical protein